MLAVDLQIISQIELQHLFRQMGHDSVPHPHMDLITRGRHASCSYSVGEWGDHNRAHASSPSHEISNADSSSWTENSSSGTEKSSSLSLEVEESSVAS